MISQSTPGLPAFTIFRSVDLRNNRRDVLPQPRQIISCSIPDLVKVDAEILVDEEMPHGDDIFPWYPRVLLLELRRYCCLQLHQYAARRRALASMVFSPALLPAVAVAAVALLGGTAVARRRSRRLVLAVAAASVLLTIGLAGAWLLRGRPRRGLSGRSSCCSPSRCRSSRGCIGSPLMTGSGPASGVREENDSSIGKPQQSRRESLSSETVTTNQCGAPHPEPGFRTTGPGGGER